MSLPDRCRAEIVELHAFFADWFNGAIEDTDAAFARFTDVLHAEFRMVVPSGATLDRTQVLDRVRAARASAGADGPFAIETRNHEARVVLPGAVLVSYEEWQRVGDTPERGRVSTVLFTPADDAPHGVVWRFVHETELDTRKE